VILLAVASVILARFKERRWEEAIRAMSTRSCRAASEYNSKGAKGTKEMKQGNIGC